MIGIKPITPEEMIRIIPDYFKHTRGIWEGKPFNLMGWQKDFIKKVFGNIDAEGYRIYKKAYIEIPKKSGKSEFGALIALWLLLFDREKSAEIYSAASDRDQASICFNIAARMIELSPDLSAKCTVIQSRKTITNKNNGVYRVLSAEAFSKSGYSISGCVFDELHTQKNRELYDILEQGSGAARRQPLTLFLTTSGWDKSSICYEIHEYSKSVLTGAIKDKTFYACIYSAEGMDTSLESTWKAANPALGSIIRLEDFRNDYLQAMRSPAAVNNFLRLRLNLWTDAQSRWLDSDKYLERADGQPIDEQSLYGKPCYGGLDLSSTTDLSAWTMCFPPDLPGGKYRFIHRFFIPGASMEIRSRRDRVPYQAWSKSGHVLSTSGDVIDYRLIKETILKDSVNFNIQEIGVDPYNSTATAQDLTEAGLVIFPVRQGYLTMSPMAKEFEIRLLNSELDMGKSPVMRWMAGNVEIVSDPAGNIKPMKPTVNSPARIDGIISSIMALNRAILATPEESIYEHRGVLSF